MIHVTSFMWYGLAFAGLIGLARLIHAVQANHRQAPAVEQQGEREADVIRARARSVSAANGHLERGVLRPADPVESVRVRRVDHSRAAAHYGAMLAEAQATACPHCGGAKFSRIGYCEGCGAYVAEHDVEAREARFDRALGEGRR